MSVSDQNIQNAQNTLHGTQLFKRSAKLVFGYPANEFTNGEDAIFVNHAVTRGVDVSGLDLAFDVQKSLKPTEFNTAHIKVWNLSEDTRLKLSGDKTISCRLEAGYIGAISQLYFAELRSAVTRREGPDFVSVLESTDSIARPSGGRQTKRLEPNAINGQIYRTMGARVPLDKAFQAIADAMGIGPGNLKQALASPTGRPIDSVNGSMLIGNAARRMTDICRSAGLEWSIQDGNLQLLNIAETLSTTQAIEISAGTGMLDSPVVDSQGALSVSTLLIPGLAPGGLINVDSLFVRGGYRIEKIRYVGDTKGNEWTAHIEAVKY